MNQPNDSAGVAVQEKCRVFAYHSTKVLTLSVQFLEICLNENPQAQARINARFRAQGSNFARYAAGTLYRQAVRDYHRAQEHNYPFRSYDAAMKYEVAMNQDCYFSAYRDQYEFTGGVHGNTVRASDTFSLRNGRKFALSHFFAPGVNYRQLVTAEILKQAEKNVQNDPTVYFNNYKHLILKYFRPENYYLTSEGIAIYYQQYDIAPYSTGIVTFILPYKALEIQLACPGRC